MAEEITQEMVDKLADIHWWIRGYRMSGDCVFNVEHLDALRIARVKLMNLMELKNKGK